MSGKEEFKIGENNKHKSKALEFLLSFEKFVFEKSKKKFFQTLKEQTSKANFSLKTEF